MPKKIICEVSNVTRVHLRGLGQYYTQLRYVGRGGAFVELRVERRWTGTTSRFAWFYRLNGGLWFGPFRSASGKVEALIDAAHRCGRSALDIDWFPYREPDRSIRHGKVGSC